MNGHGQDNGHSQPHEGAGGGGAGGLLTNYQGTAFSVLLDTNYTVTVGGGGAGNGTSGRFGQAFDHPLKLEMFLFLVPLHHTLDIRYLPSLWHFVEVDGNRLQLQ